jgi:hypothetical protein
MGALVFIDTNIFLDFYRVRGREKGLSILDHIDQNLDHFITGSQVEMEFKKNWQRVILESRQSIKPPDFGGLKQLPAFLAQSKQSSGLATNEQEVKGMLDRLRTRIGRVLEDPTRHDRVWQTAQRLFRYDSPYNLSRDTKIRFKIRNFARKRFSLGYPPRKQGDTSIGDAVNWEWIVHCAAESGRDVVIVTRDSDYGATFDGRPVLNDSLGQEFRERVSMRRKLTLTDRLSEGLKSANIRVTRKEVKDEEEFLEEKREERRMEELQTHCLDGLLILVVQPFLWIRALLRPRPAADIQDVRVGEDVQELVTFHVEPVPFQHLGHFFFAVVVDRRLGVHRLVEEPREGDLIPGLRLDILDHHDPVLGDRVVEVADQLGDGARRNVVE